MPAFLSFRTYRCLYRVSGIWGLGIDSGAGGDYAPVLQGNQSTLRDDALPLLDDPATPLFQDTQIGKGHGRIETRSASISAVVDRLPAAQQWPGWSAAGKVSAIRQQDDVVSEPSRCYLLIEARVRRNGSTISCGGIGGLHRALDAIGNEDQTRNRKWHWAANLALLR